MIIIWIKNASTFIKIFLSFGKFVTDRLEREYYTFLLLKKNNLVQLTDDFKSVYFNTLYSISENKSKDLLKLFALTEVMKAFEQEYIQDKPDEFWRSFEHNLHTNPNVRKLKQYSINVDQEIDDFKKAFKDTIKLTRTPKEKETSDKIERIDSNVSNLLTTGIQDDLKHATSFMESFDHEKAFGYLENLYKNKWTIIAPMERYKILANIGWCKLIFEKGSEAAKDLIAALEYNPNDSKALSYAALGYNINNDFEKCKKLAEESISKDGLNFFGWMCLINAAKTENDFNLIVARIPSELQRNSTICYAINMYYIRAANLPLAEEWLRKALEYDPKRSPEYLATLGMFIQGKLSSYVEVQMGQISDYNKKNVNESIGLLTEAIDKIKDHDLIKYRWWWYTNRALLKRMQNDTYSAISDLREAYRLSNDKIDRLIHLAYALVQFDQYSEALDIFNRLKKLQSEDGTNDIAIAHCLIELKKQPEAIEMLKKELQKTVNPSLKDNLIHMLIRASVEIEDFSYAEELVNELLNNRPNLLSTYLNTYYFYEKKGDFVNATKSALKAYESINQNLIESPKHSELANLALLLLSYKEYSKAIEVFLKFVNPSIHSKYIEPLVSAYVLNKNLDKAFDIIKELKTTYGLTQSLIETEVYIYEEIGDIKKAVSVCEDYLKIDVSNQTIRARLAKLYFANRDFENTKKNIDFIKDFTVFPFQIAYKFVYILFSIGDIEKSLEVAYQIRRNNYSNGEAHKLFIQIALQLKPSNEILINLPEIKENTGVSLKDSNDQTSLFILIDAKEIHEDQREISISSENGKALLGKKVGDTVILGNSRSYSIVSIVHKFVQATTDSFLLLETRFPGVKGLEFHKMKGEGGVPSKEDIKALTDLLDRKNEHSQDLLDKYKQGVLPIGFIASLSGQNPIEICGGFINDGLGMFTYSSVINEYPIAVDKLLNDKAVLLDITSIMTLYRLKMLEKVKESLVMYISNSTLDLIKDHIAQLNIYGPEGSMSMYKKDDTYYRSEISKEDIDRSINSFTEMETWLRNNCQILPCEKILTIESSERELGNKTFGRSFYESMLIAQERDMLLLSDDGVLRTVANPKHQVKGISTPLLLLFLLERNFLSLEEYSDKIFLLHLFKYKGTPVNSEVLFKALEKANFHLEEPFISVVSVLSTIAPQQESGVAQIIADFLYNLNNRTIRIPNQDLICNAIFQTVIKNLTPNYYNIQIQWLQTRFRLLPLDSDRIVNNFIVCWNAIRPL